MKTSKIFHCKILQVKVNEQNKKLKNAPFTVRLLVGFEECWLILIAKAVQRPHQPID